MIGVTHQYPYIINILCVIAQASLRFGSGLARAGKCLQPCTNYQCFTRSARLRAGGPLEHFTPGAFDLLIVDLGIPANLATS